jgi:hypothetical protein
MRVRLAHDERDMLVPVQLLTFYFAVRHFRNNQPKLANPAQSAEMPGVLMAP